jgi:hypothetical protein
MEHSQRRHQDHPADRQHGGNADADHPSDQLGARALAISSKPLRQSGLLQDRIGQGPVVDIRRNRERSVRDRAEPDFVAAFAFALEAATGRAQ